jgi:peptidyl-prolyl cis-trans isomerase SurA
MKVLYDNFMKISLLDYEKAHLELKYPEYKHLLNEYREGILLFNVMEDVVWSTASNDSIGLKTYYQKKFNQYQTQESVTISIFEYSNEIDSAKFNRIVQTIFNDSTRLPGIAEKEIRQNFPEITIVKSGTFQKDDNLENEVFRPNGIYKLTGDEGINKILVVWKYDPVYYPEFENIRGSVISDYQEYIENNWLNNLREKYPVVMNKKELKKIYRRFVR